MKNLDTKNEAKSREYYIKKNRKFRNLIKENLNEKKNSHTVTLQRKIYFKRCCCSINMGKRLFKVKQPC